MSILKKVAIGAGGLLVVLAGVIATRPASFRVERSAEVAAPPQAVFGLINDFHNWQGWSPWEALDPGMRRTYEGSASGTGAAYGWTGNDKVGQGRMTIVESQAPERVVIKLEFIKPWAVTNTTIFTIVPSGSGARVTWAMEGHNDFMGKAMSLLMNMDRLIGGDFERGLSSLKTLAERAPSEAPRAER